MTSPFSYLPQLSDAEGARDWYVKNNLSATTDPSASDDSSAGYKVGSTWINTATANARWNCVDDSVGAAVWTRSPNVVDAGTSAGTGNQYGGYVEIGAVLLQWGVFLSTQDSSQTVNLPTAFANTNYVVTFGYDSDPGIPGTGVAIAGVVASRTTTTFDFDRDNDIDGTTFTVNYFAIGQK